MSIFEILINNSKSDANRLYFNCVFHVKKENSIKIINNDETNSNYGEFIQVGTTFREHCFIDNINYFI